ncbi:MAG TPA: folylpolyglutamate synthase/dihydrofolate synthase family protein [Terriglobales bacterium]|nr:folylpolyglutamate synthase/dihydrofolate synthase family protein [Terriglobales bacterium]
MNPAECRDYLGHLQHFGIKLGLENITALLAALGDPHRAFPSVHVAGTNGKGSVSAMLERILRGRGLRTGLYTSPHLVTVEERIQVAGRPISAERFGDLVGRVKGTIDGLMEAGGLVYHPTFFEVLTAVAFLHFAESRLDVAVLEVGMGGRFDATNVVRPLVSVITTIARDHEKHLGSTLREIAFEKAGIIKPGVPAVCGAPGGAALAEIRRVARERGAPLTRVFGPGKALEARRTATGFRFRYSSGAGEYSFIPGLAGEYQGANAAVAIAASEVLGRIWRPLPKAVILRGIREARWPGRLETVHRRPLVVLDGAHNEEGAGSLAAHIAGVIRRPVILVFAVMKDKNIRAMARRLFPRARTVILTRVPYKRSAEPEAILAAAGEFRDRARIEPDVAEAVRLALEESAGRAPVVIAGSLFLVGEVKRLQLFATGSSKYIT